MYTQSFNVVKDKIQNIFYLVIRKTKRSIFLFPAILSTLLLFSCKKSMDVTARDNAEVNLTNPSSGATVSDYEETVPYDQTLFIPCGNGGAGDTRGGYVVLGVVLDVVTLDV